MENALIEQARVLAQKGENAKAFNCIARLPKNFKWKIKDLLLKARLIMLADRDVEWSLSDVEEILGTALKIDPDNLETLVELGFFHSRVMDDEKRGLAFFESVLNKSQQPILEAVEGIKEIRCNGKNEEENPLALKNIETGFKALKKWSQRRIVKVKKLEKPK